MATLYIAELDNLQQVPEGAAQIALLPPIAEQTVAIGGVSTQSALFNPRTKYLRLAADSVCAVASGTNPTAAVTTGTNANAAGGSWRLAANQTEYVGIVPATSLRLAVIATT